MLTSEKEKLAKMKMSHEVSPLENPKLITFTRKVIARIKTEISRRKIEKTANIGINNTSLNPQRFDVGK